MAQEGNRVFGVAIGLRLAVCPVSRPPLIEFPDPDIAEADWLAFVAVRLELDGCAGVTFVEWLAFVQRLALQLEMVLHQDSVKEDRDIGGSFRRAVCVEGGRCPHYVVGLPFP